MTSLQQREEQVRTMLEPELGEYVDLLSRVHNWFAQCADAVADRDLPEPAVITLVMATRTMGDLRVCQLAAETGYALQAQSIAATIHELAFATAYIGESEERAAAWLAHENERKQYPECGHLAVLKEVRQHVGASAIDAEGEYQIYRQLCWAKHGNPVVQRKYGVVDGDRFRYIEQVPHYSEATVFLARFSVLHAARAVAFLLGRMAQWLFSAVINDPLTDEYEAVWSEIWRLGTRDHLLALKPDRELTDSTA